MAPNARPAKAPTAIQMATLLLLLILKAYHIKRTLCWERGTIAGLFEEIEKVV